MPKFEYDVVEVPLNHWKDAFSVAVEMRALIDFKSRKGWRPVGTVCLPKGEILITFERVAATADPNKDPSQQDSDVAGQSRDVFEGYHYDADQSGREPD